MSEEPSNLQQAYYNDVSNIGYVGSMQLELPPPPKWEASFLERTWVFSTAKNPSWWFRFWTKVFFNARWKRL